MIQASSVSDRDRSRGQLVRRSVVGAGMPIRETEVLPDGVQATERRADGGERTCCNVPESHQNPSESKHSKERDQVGPWA
jgi:hypothetical protein